MPFDVRGRAGDVPRQIGDLRRRGDDAQRASRVRLNPRASKCDQAGQPHNHAR